MKIHTLKKRLVCAALAGLLCLTAARAQDVAAKFPAVNTYPGYADVAETDWFYDNAKLCYETGLMTGTQNGFEPTLTLSVGQTATIAARMREILTGEPIPRPTPKPGQKLPWYAAEVGYLQHAGIAVPEPEKDATRLEFVKLLSAVLPDGVLSAINEISVLPDTADADVLEFYNAGILTGINKYGTFAGERTLTRHECAAMVSRIIRPALRQPFTPVNYAPFTAAGVEPQTPFFEGNVTAADFLPAVLSVITELENACTDAGVEFNWFNTYGNETFLEYVDRTALTQLGVTKEQALPIYRQFDVQVYYSRYLSLARGT